ncbi:MAG: mechanosensitive ion channel domain-containing protein [archaeon]
MKEKSNGLFIGGLLLVLFIIYFFRIDFYNGVLNNYFTISQNISVWIPKLVTIIIILLFAKLIQVMLNHIYSKYFKYVGREKDYYSVKSVTKYSILILTFIGILSVIIGDLGVWLTSVGLIGFGITFALQKPILNFVAWLTLIFNKEYIIGDRIMIGKERGDVIDIKMMNTIIDGLLDNSDEFSGKIITIPNSMVLTDSVINYTKSGEYIWDNISIDITYESNWEQAVEMLQDITFKVVNKHVTGLKNEKSDKHEGLIEKLQVLKAHRKESTGLDDKKLIEKHIGEVEFEKEKLEGRKRFALQDIKKVPHVRVDLKESSISLSVRYLAHYKHLRRMKSEINSSFLYRISKIKNINIAYPHIQIVNSK